MKNIVLYSNGHPVVSVSPDDTGAAFKVGAAATRAINAADAAGIGSPKLVCVAEEREASADGKVVTRESFQLLDASSLAPKGKAVSDLSKLLKGD